MKYLNPGPFSLSTSSSRVTQLQYDIAVGRLVLCEKCGEYYNPDSGHTEKECAMAASF